MEFVNKDILKTTSNTTKLDDRKHKVLADIANVTGFFETVYLKARRNIDFYANRQWTENEVAEHSSQNRKAYVFNEISHKIDHIVGMQMQTRMDSKVLPREKGDAKKAELIQHLLKWVEQNAVIEQVESAVFADGIIKGSGAAVVRWEMEDLAFGYPTIEKVPTNELMWDLNSKKVDLSDADWMARTQYLSRAKLLELFPEHKNVISRTPAGGSKPGPNTPTYKQDMQSNRMGTQNTARDIIPMVEHYEKMKLYEYVVSDLVADENTHFTKKKDAKEYFKGLVEHYTKNDILIASAEVELVVFKTIRVTKIYQTILIGDTPITATLTSLNVFPFVLYFPYFMEGEYWSFLESLIDPQILVNRLFSQWDYAVGTQMKNAMTVVPQKLDVNYKLSDLEFDMSKTAPIIPVKTHDAINPLVNERVNPEMFQGIDFSINRMTDYSGGRNTMGLQENAAESGKAVNARVEQGGLARLPLFDKLRLWRKNVAMQFTWYIKNYMPARQITRIVGTEDIEFLDIDDDVYQTISEMKLDIVIDEAVKSATMRERNFEQLKDIMITMGGQIPPEVMMPILLEYSSIPESKKDEILKQVDIYQKYIETKGKLAEYDKMLQSINNAELRSQIKDQKQLQEQIVDETDNTNREVAELQKERQELDKEAQTFVQG